MYILHKRADQLTSDDIKRLVANQVKESKSLDYKKELKLSQDKDKKEFLFDVSSMSNTDGGCLIYGIEEYKDDKNQNTGVPETIIGIIIENFDKLSQQIEDTVKGNTDPSISNIILNHLEVDEKSILVIGIAKNLGLPVMVTFNESNKFYRRRNSGKYAVDVYELNQMFMQNQVLKEKAEKFRQERIEKVRSLKVFPTLDVSASYFLQIIPFSFLNETLLDFTDIQSKQLATTMRPMSSNGWDHMHNFDGYATFTKSLDRMKIDGYNQVFRNGIYEVYTARQFEAAIRNGTNINDLYGDTFISETLEKVSSGLTVLKQFHIEPPFLICISIHGILGGTIRANGRPSRPFMIDDILLPPILLPEYETDLYTKLKPVFDILWQAAAYPSSSRLK